MKILHVVSDLQKASGVTVFVEELANELRAAGHLVDFLIRTQISDFTSSLRPDYDIVHIHGLWDLFLHRCSDAARKAGVKVVWSPHGMLQKWALKNKWWKKLPALAFYQWRDLHSAAFLHATAQSEVDDIRRLGLRNKVVVSPLGVRLSPECNRTVKHSNVQTLLFVSRVQRKKGLPNLIEAWSRLSQDLRKDWQVRIVGPDQDNHVAELKSQCDRLGLTYTDETIRCTTKTSNFDFTFTGPKYDAELDAEYANADLFVLPTHSENFGSVVVEAFARGVPVITTKGAPWQELETEGCGKWIEVGVEPLVDALREMVSLTAEQRSQMGERGHALVARKYTWKSAAEALIKGYEEVLRGRA